MRQETNNEMDLLLRRLGRRDGDSMRDGEAQPDDRHLDADEMSSFAQNALPAPARARYMEHLAECGSCRKLVTELSLSLGATAAAPVETVSVAGGLKKFLASLLSPLVLRYAVPALGLLVAAVVGVVVLRQQQSQPFTARMEEKPNQPAVVAKSDARAPAQANGQSPTESDKSPMVDKSRQKPEQRVSSPGVTKPESGVAEERDAPAPAREKGEASAAAEPAPSATPPPPAAPKVAAKSVEAQPQTVVVQTARPATVDQVTADGEVEKAQANEWRRRGVETQSRERADQDKDKKESEDSRGFIGGKLRSPSRPGAAEATKDKAETRSVAGRRFRKERGIWTDTAYDSSTATVNVARGSEQFRALIADEPELETIAKQLDGEVIVVWKGRAYRIR